MVPLMVLSPQNKLPLLKAAAQFMAAAHFRSAISRKPAGRFPAIAWLGLL
jgi:hypothetical protein